MAMYGYTLEDVYVPSYDTSGKSAKSDPLPVEDFTFGYEKIDFDSSDAGLFFVSGENKDTDPMAGLLLPAVQAAPAPDFESTEVSPFLWYDL